MAETLAPATLPPGSVDALLAQAISVASIAADPTLTTAEPETPQARLAHELRTRLAVRDWINPHLVIGSGHDEQTVALALNAVAPEVETSFALRPGEWYLSVPSRRRVLAERSRETLRQELDVPRCPSDAADPVRLILRQEFGLDPRQELKQLSTDMLRALAHVRSWLGRADSLKTGQQQIESELASRLRNDDLSRVTALPMLGRVHGEALARLVAELTGPTKQGLSATYITGNGGSGKSTLLAFLQRTLIERPAPPPVVRLDFDDPFINAKDPISLDLALFDQLGKSLPHLIPRLSWPLEHLRSDRVRQHSVRREGDVSANSPVQSLEAESVDVQEKSERDSILFGQLSDVAAPAPGAPLILILDTAEVVMTQGIGAIIELAKWLRSLVNSLGAHEVRVVIAGRDPHDYALGDSIGGIFSRFGIALRPPIELPELTPPEAMRLLENAGVEDKATARTAAGALPGNPLLLRIAADVLMSSTKIAHEVRRVHSEGRIDRTTARIYLARRIVAHLTDCMARPYLLPAMYLPMVTEELLRMVVMPVVDGTTEAVSTAKSSRAFAALAATRWLSQTREGGESLQFHRDVRCLILKLLDADPEEAPIRRAIRERAIAYHSSQAHPSNRAFEAYHRWMRGETDHQLDETLLDHLTQVFEELPVDVKARFKRRQASSLRATPAFTDEEWLIHLEGPGGADGQGDKMLKRGHALEALDLYRSRPTRPMGLAPTFVIQALADTGQWDTPEVSLDLALGEIESWAESGRLSGSRLSRLYWITRLELMRRGATLSPRHADMLERSCHQLRGPALSTLPALVAVAEARLGRRLSPASWDAGKGARETATRIFLVHGHMGASIAFRPRIDSIAVTQGDWTDALRAIAPGTVDLPGANWVQSALDSLNDRPFADVGRVMRGLEKPVAVRWDGADLEAGILVLRGLTTEFLRPLRHTLSARFEEPDGAGSLMPLIEYLLGQMSIRPIDFSMNLFVDRLHGDAHGWFAALVGYADRCRLLPVLCQGILRLPGGGACHSRLLRVAQAFLDWDRALCAGGTSAWRPAAGS